MGANWASFLLQLPPDPSGDFTFSQRKAAEVIVGITPADAQDSRRPFRRFLVCHRTAVRLLNWQSDIQLLTLLNLFFELLSRRRSIWNRCSDRLKGRLLSVNGPGLYLRSTREGKNAGRWTVLSMRVTYNWSLEFHGCQSQVKLLQGETGNTERLASFKLWCSI